MDWVDTVFSLESGADLSYHSQSEPVRASQSVSQSVSQPVSQAARVVSQSLSQSVSLVNSSQSIRANDCI